MTDRYEAGTTRSGPLWQDDCLAPPAIPTGEKPADVLNVIWRKNEVFLDIGSWALGSAVMVIWPPLMLFLGLGIYTGDLQSLDGWYIYGFMCFCGIPSLLLAYSLTKPVPPPIRFNRQRREVCVPQKDGSHWFVPWESVKAVGTAVSSVGQHGRATQGLLVIGFPNPQWNGKSEEDKEYSLALSCGGGITAMAMWECIRSYMEVGPEAVPRCTYEGTERQGFFSVLWMMLSQVGRKLKEGDLGGVLYDLFFIVCLGAPLAGYLQVQKLAPPPDLTDPSVVEWSKPLPPNQWARRSAELERAIQAREADLRERSSQ
ncbi:hypothetical protein FA459_23495 [Pseudomonas aeruginosa]|uniref:hypothetical protein n=1 Tax=Pseudomonas aeruginosa TaxID=287 RepID=UPI00383A312C|nr:hypothetical protein [Pseudomonas aeruginosa]MCO1771036.1 hypothetical protein [Pseudomonas aeruginosa]